MNHPSLRKPVPRKEFPVPERRPGMNITTTLIGASLAGAIIWGIAVILGWWAL